AIGAAAGRAYLHAIEAALGRLTRRGAGLRGLLQLTRIVAAGQFGTAPGGLWLSGRALVRPSGFPHLPHLSTAGSRRLAISMRRARVAGCSAASGWRPASQAMMPPSFINALAANRPHCRFS